MSYFYLIPVLRCTKARDYSLVATISNVKFKKKRCIISEVCEVTNTDKVLLLTTTLYPVNNQSYFKLAFTHCSVTMLGQMGCVRSEIFMWLVSRYQQLCKAPYRNVYYEIFLLL